MRAVIQRVAEASVKVGNNITGSIRAGLLILAGFEESDTREDIEWLAKKIIQLRIFSDNGGLMNLSVKDTGGDILIVSQFTLHALTKKGNRPSFIKAARPEFAIPLYEDLIRQIEEYLEKPVRSGVFGAMMEVSLINDGPVTIIIDTKERE